MPSVKKKVAFGTETHVFLQNIFQNQQCSTLSKGSTEPSHQGIKMINHYGATDGVAGFGWFAEKNGPYQSHFATFISTELFLF